MGGSSTGAKKAGGTQVREEFLREIEARLKENRRLARDSWLPKPLWGAASYLAFHTFRSLVLLALVVALVVYFIWFEWLVEVGKMVFLYGK